MYLLWMVFEILLKLISGCCEFLFEKFSSGLKRRKRRAADVLDEKWRQVKFYLRTLPKIIKKVQSRDPAFLNSLEEQQQ